jgi:hypothetical protein
MREGGGGGTPDSSGKSPPPTSSYTYVDIQSFFITIFSKTGACAFSFPSLGTPPGFILKLEQLRQYIDETPKPNYTTLTMLDSPL